MNRRRILIVASAVVAASGLQPTAIIAQQVDQPALPDAAAMFRQLRERLALTDAQAETIRPLMKHSFEQRREVLDRYGLGEDGTLEKLSFRDKRRLRKELEAIRNETQSELSEILSEAQFAELEKIQEEARQRVRAKLESGRMDTGR